MKDCFYKKMTKKNIEKYLFLNSLTFKMFKVPKIIKINKKGIFFELIDYDNTLLNLLKTDSRCKNIIYNVWSALWELHLALEWTKKWFHNDFWPWNILIKWNTLYIIDFEEFEWFDSLDIENSLLLKTERDLSMFLFHLKYDISIFNIFRKDIMYSNEFLNWYGKITGNYFYKKDIKKYILIHINNMIQIKRKKNVKEFIKIFVWKFLYKCFNY